MATNRCQYWNVYEPHQCVYWDTGAQVCNYVATKTEEASVLGESTSEIITPIFAPYCNYIGTTVTCPQFKSPNPGEYSPRCMLPDPMRHVCNRWTGNKWVSISGTSDTDAGKPDFSPINGYNEGTCDGAGTDTTCSGYSPQHLGFGRLVPSDDGSKDIKDDYSYSKLAEFDSRLPLHYALFNLRAKLSKCMFWSGDYLPFTVNSGTLMVELAGTWMCSNENDTSTYSDFSAESGAPCNGCKPECPHYSGVCWEYCVDELVQSGDPVLAEQVHELRYYCRENGWTTEDIADYFFDQGYIYTWSGKHAPAADGAADLKGTLDFTVNAETNTIEEYQIPSVKTSMSTFDTFQVDREDTVLTKGTTVDGELLTFPSLVRGFSSIQLNPIIKNRFDLGNVFESSAFGETHLLLYGKVFTAGEVFVINISHQDVFSSIPQELFMYDCLLDIRNSMGTVKFNDFYTNYENTINLLKSAVVAGNHYNKLSADENTTFIVEAPIYPATELFAGVNTLVVFQNSSDGLLFSKIGVVKNLVGGALIQTRFALEGDNIPVKSPVDYTKGLNAHINDNGEIAFEFFPFSNNNYKSSLSYFYDDTSFGGESGSMPSEKSTQYRGYKEYEVFAEDYFLSEGGSADGDDREYYLLGDDGYVLIKINEPNLNRVFRPWEFDKVEAQFEDGTTCEFEKVYSGADDSFLEVNQMVVKPKNNSDFKSLCGATLFVRGLKYYMRLSFDEEPDVSSMWEYSFIDDSTSDLVINYGKVTYDAVTSGNTINISKFQFIMTPSAVIANAAGRPFALFRTKAIGWLKQNMCPAVEMYYQWSANYVEWTNVPICRCCGEWSEQNARPAGDSLTPPCGDHDISGINGVGRLWWPFTACDPYATYDIISNLDNYSFDVIGIFKQTNEGGDKLHGDHDMRMLGPPTYEAYHGRGCNFLIPCSCSWRTYNLEKSSENTFSGFGRIRSGVSSGELSVWKDEGEVLPKFGNSVRPLLESYRTLGKEQYLKSDDGGSTWTVAWRVMPAFMAYNSADFLDTTVESVWDYGGSDIDGAPPVQNPLGFFLASSFEGSSIGETIDYTNRFYFDEICHVSITVDTIRYPKTVGKYSFSKKTGKIYPWFEFKAYSPPKTGYDSEEGSGGSSSGPMIQWAWQERWKPLERLTSEEQSKSDFIREYLTGITIIAGDTYLQDPETGAVTGMLKFLELDYPEYLYNYKLTEFTTVTNEGHHVLAFIAPERDESTGEYTGYMGVSLDGGPIRGISWTAKDWLTEDNASENIKTDDYNLELYKKCTGLGGTVSTADEEISWFDGSTLFDFNCQVTEDSVEDAADMAEDMNQMVESYGEDDGGKQITKKKCYMQGLSVNINSESFGSAGLPTKKVDTPYLLGTINTTTTSEDGAFTAVCGSVDTIDICVNFDNLVKTIAIIGMTYNYGAEVIAEQASIEDLAFKYYHIPAIAVYTSDDGTTKKDLLFERDYMTLYQDASEGLSTDTLFYSWDNSFDYLFAGALYVIITLRVTPNEGELSELSEEGRALYEASTNLIQYSISGIYEELLTNATESIKTWERKYYVSYGDSADSPPQGTNPEEVDTLFAARSYEKSTVYQQDSVEGVNNIDGSSKDGFTITSKVRGRILHKIYEDETNLSGDVYTMEGVQKKLFDASIKTNPTTAAMSPIVPPSLQEALSSEGVRFLEAGGTFTLENTLLSELAEINSFQPINGEGHKYLPSDYHEDNCKGWCGDKENAVFTYIFTCMDEEADGAYTGQGYDDAYTAFYWGTYNYLARKDLAETVIENVFNKKYGGSSETKIWVDDSESELLFYTLEPLMDTVTVAGADISYNLNYLAVSMNWQNAYFNTAENSGWELATLD